MSAIDCPSAWINIEDPNNPGKTLQILNVAPYLTPEVLEELLKALSATTPKASIVNVAVAGDKLSHTFQDGTKKFLVRSEKVSEIKYNFSEVDYDLNKRLTITSGGFLKESGLLLTGKSIYFTADKNNVDVEILEWL